MTAIFFISAFLIWTVVLPIATAAGGYLLGAFKMSANSAERGRWCLAGMGIASIGAASSLVAFLTVSSGTQNDMGAMAANIIAILLLVVVYFVGSVDRRVQRRLARIEAM